MSVRGGEIVRADVGILEKQPQILGDPNGGINGGSSLPWFVPHVIATGSMVVRQVGESQREGDRPRGSWCLWQAAVEPG